ncbi:MAG: UDP-2,3-diacylglucosamine diphosphatase [Bacillota bacterium]
MTTLFISDLHLDASRPEITELFLTFLRDEAARAAQLYILGDFFEAWIGDDDDDPHHARIMDGLKALTVKGVPVSLMHGNRDFLMGEAFLRRTGAKLLPDPTVIPLGGRPTLLMHGDTLCTDDKEYQMVRRMLRDPAWQKDYLAKPLSERRAIAAHAREQSKKHTALQADYIMDVNQQAVEEAMHKHGVARLIHGHTHRPAVHRFKSGGQDMERIVLGDWYEQSSKLSWNENRGLLTDARVKNGSAD